MFRYSRSVIERIPRTQRTMESARTAFHAQLATVMDSLLAAAVCEIAKIFESSLCDQQVALAQKTEELAVLRGELERVERRPRPAKDGGSEEGEMPSGHGGGFAKQQLSGSGMNVEKDASSHSDPVDGLGHSLGRGPKEEVTVQDGAASVKLEPAVSQLTFGSVSVQTPERSLAAPDQRQKDSHSAPQAKAELSHWDQGSCGADHRSIQDQAVAPFLSISQSGRFSPRPDPSLAHPREWLPGLDANQGRVSSLGNMQMEGTSRSGPDTSCFQAGFAVSDETSNEDDNGSFPFLDQEPESQNSNQKSVQGQGVGQRGTEQVEPRAHSGEPPWGPRDDGGVRGPINDKQRPTSFGNRDPLRPQSTSQSLTLRHTNSPRHPAPPDGGNRRPYSCPYCNKCFTYPSHQRRHLLRHTGIKLHPCQFCEKSFLTPSELTVHTRTHTGERPFGCVLCGKRFGRSGNLKAHQRDVHMGKRPFACTACGKRFSHRGNMRVHNHRVHQGDPYCAENQQEPGIAPNPI